MTAAPDTQSNGDADLLKTPLHALHVEARAKMVPFAGYELPVQYPTGVLSEHLHTRSNAGLFDVSHMGQIALIGRDHAHVSGALEALVPGAVLEMEPGQVLYSMLLNDGGGILDDLLITRPVSPGADGRLDIVINAACKTGDIAHLSARLPGDVELVEHRNRALLALQGPRAESVLAPLTDSLDALAFMEAAPRSVGGIACGLSRSGYTGEDGFEISVPAEGADRLARQILGHSDVMPIGLGARDSLRLEAGLCLYGHDLDETISPVEASLSWAIGKRRRTEGGFPGAERILDELANGPKRRRVGLRPEGRAPAREGVEVVDLDGKSIGTITSGGFGPSLQGPCSMAMIDAAQAKTGTAVGLVVRGKTVRAEVVRMPFVPHRYRRRSA